MKVTVHCETCGRDFVDENVRVVDGRACFSFGQVHECPVTEMKVEFDVGTPEKPDWDGIE